MGLLEIIWAVSFMIVGIGTLVYRGYRYEGEAKTYYDFDGTVLLLACAAIAGSIVFDKEALMRSWEALYVALKPYSASSATAFITTIVLPILASSFAFGLLAVGASHVGLLARGRTRSGERQGRSRVTQDGKEYQS
ncbi:MAG: hypothetical protein ACOZE7_04435 [Pseudomonadota bacterium]